MRLLLVEDNKVLADWLSRTLRKQLYAVDCVDNGADADFVLRTETYDLVLLDLALPKLDGHEVLRRLRADSTTRDTPVVVVSADATGVARDELLSAGASRYLTKPVAMADLLAAVDELAA